MNEVSLKGLLQGLSTSGVDVVQGTVIQTDPLKIQVAGDDMLIVSAASIYVPRHLTTHTVAVSLNSEPHSHTFSYSGLTEKTDEHNHAFSVTGSTSEAGGSSGEQTMTVYNALSAGDEVYLLAFRDNKQYYVLDRVG